MAGYSNISTVNSLAFIVEKDVCNLVRTSSNKKNYNQRCFKQDVHHLRDKLIKATRNFVALQRDELRTFRWEMLYIIKRPNPSTQKRVQIIIANENTSGG